LEIRVSKLQEIMELLKPVVPKNPTLKAVVCVYLGEGKAVATDLETMIIANLPEAKEPMLLPYSAISAMLKFVPGIKLLKIELKGRAVSLSWEGGSASYPTEDVANFPIMPELATKAEGLIDGDTLLAAMQTALPYVAPPPAKGAAGRPTLEGITLVLGNPTEVAAGDGFRASIQALGISFPLETKVILPSHSVAIMQHVFKKTPRTPPTNAGSLVQAVTAKRNLRMALIGDNKLRLDYGTSASVVMNLIVGEPPKWLTLVPTGDPIMQSDLFAPQMAAALKRVQAIAKDGNDAVRLEFAEGKLKVSAVAKDQEVSSIVETIHTQGEQGRVALNVKYLLEYFSEKQGIVTFTRFTENGPIVLEYMKTPKVLIMPMKIEWEVTPPEEVKEEPAVEATEETPTAETEEETTGEDENEATAEEESAEETEATEEPAATE